MSQQPLSEPIAKTRETNDVRALPVLPVRDTVLFPHAVLPLPWAGSSVQLINSLGEDKTIVVVAQREARVDNPQPSDLYTVGTSAVVHKVVKMPNQSLFVFAEGLERVRLSEFTQLAPFMRARVSTIPEAASPESSEIEALQRNVLTLFQQIVAGSPTLSDELSTVALNIDEPGRLVDFIASSLPSLSTRTSRTRWKLWTFACAWRRSTASCQGTRSAATAQQDPERSAGSRAANSARVLPARADEGHSERIGRAG